MSVLETIDRVVHRSTKNHSKRLSVPHTRVLSFDLMKNDYFVFVYRVLPREISMISVSVGEESGLECDSLYLHLLVTCRNWSHAQIGASADHGKARVFRLFAQN